jgi:hypothetical protein
MWYSVLDTFTYPVVNPVHVNRFSIFSFVEQIMDGARDDVHFLGLSSILSHWEPTKVDFVKSALKILVKEIVGDKSTLKSIFILFLELDPHSQ